MKTPEQQKRDEDWSLLASEVVGGESFAHPTTEAQQITHLKNEVKRLNSARHDLELRVAQLEEALRQAVSAGSYVVNLIKATSKAGDSPNPNERADWIGTCSHAYAAMSFLKPAQDALSTQPLQSQWVRREVADKLVEAIKQECKPFRFPDEDRPIIWSALSAYESATK